MEQATSCAWVDEGWVSRRAHPRPGRSAYRERRRAGGGPVALLGAMLALGTGLAGCEGERRLDPKLPALSMSPMDSSPLEDDAPAAALPPESIGFEAEEGREGRIELGPGFAPDPLTREGVTAGGPVDARELDRTCQGFVGFEPDVVVSTELAIAELSVMVASDQPTSLVVVGPDGRARCAAGPGAHAVLRGPLASGLHRVWVGARERGVRARYVLGLSELDDTHPRALLRAALAPGGGVHE